MLPSTNGTPAEAEPSSSSSNPLEPQRRHYSFTKKVLGPLDGKGVLKWRRSARSRSRMDSGFLKTGPPTAQAEEEAGLSKGEYGQLHSRLDVTRSADEPPKLGTFAGVFVPTSLNVLSILMFLRFGLILGQSGALGMMGMLIISYIINLITTLSISAVATNGTVRGGGAYYLISRSLGPEFGGSIGIVFYLGSVFNSGMNAVGLIDCLKQNFGSSSGTWTNWLPEGQWWEYLWATLVLIICTVICLAGSAIFARASLGLLMILLISTFSIPVSAFFVKPFVNGSLGTEYTGFSLATLKDNLFPKFTRHPAGSQHHQETFQSLFGLIFPATGGIFAGASMSGSLKYPSKAIPKGTLTGLALTFFAYTVVIIAMAATITRNSFYNNINVVQDTNVSGILILLGEFATTFFSSLMGVIGSAKLLQALARDNLIPGLSLFSQGTRVGDEPIYAIGVTYVVAQLTMLFDINQIASFVTMTYLMTFLVTNLACFLLKIGSAPNFRPSFRYFSWQTAACGTLISGASMFFVDGVYATGCVGILVVIFLVIHYTTTPKAWGDVSQSLIYHQVRKYLLRLRQEHVKFWRPQILLFINDPRRQYKLIQFCNALKKGALFVLGHVIVSDDFGSSVPEARRQQAAWTRYVDFSKVKAFVNIVISPGLEWGTRNVVLGAGLGGMRPNIVVIGAYNFERSHRDQLLVDVPTQPAVSRSASRNAKTKRPNRGGGYRRDSKREKLQGVLPTDLCKPEGDVSAATYVTILEDLLLRLQINVAVARGFQELDFPCPGEENSKKYIDLWPIQMSAEIAAEDGEGKRNVLTTNFDTYTLILQLGCILNTVPKWKKTYTLRVAVFVEYESDVEEERNRVKALLLNLRIKAEILVFWLASGGLKTYNTIVNSSSGKGDQATAQRIDDVLKDEDWWQDISRIRGKRGQLTASEELADVVNLLHNGPNWPNSSFRSTKQNSGPERFDGLRKLLRKASRRRSSGSLTGLAGRLSMTTQRLDDDDLHHTVYESESSSEDSNTSDSDSSFALSEDEVSIRDGGSILRDEEYLASDSSPPKRPPSKLGRKSSDEELFPGLNIRISGAQDPIGPDKASTTLPSSLMTSPRKFPAQTPLSAISSLLSPDTQPPNSARPRPSRRTSRFSSLPVPNTVVSTEDGPGPSIMFSDSTEGPGSTKKHSIYTSSPSASGFPTNQSIPLNFNDLPCRAQHLIVNELMKQQSVDTAVIFTTLPGPVEGTGQSEEDSISYLRDLEVLSDGLPPLLLVHSNSMTVTTNL